MQFIEGRTLSQHIQELRTGAIGLAEM